MSTSSGWMIAVPSQAQEPTALHSTRQVEAMFERCSAGIYRYVALRVGHDTVLADEIMQQLWLQVSRSNREIPEAHFEYWLRVIAKNLIASHWRKVKRRPQQVPLESPEVAAQIAERIDSEALPQEVVERREVRDQLALAVTRLRLEDQELVIRHYVQGQPFQVIAERLGVSERAVEGRLYRARKQLKQALLHLEESV